MYVDFLFISLTRLLSRVFSPGQCEYAWCMHAYILRDHVCLEITHLYFSVYCFMCSAFSFDALTDVPVHEIFFCHMTVENYYGLFNERRIFCSFLNSSTGF